MVRLVLFDIDGTLVRTSGAGVKAFAKVFETEFGAVDGFEKLKFSGRTDVSLVREFFQVHNIPATAQNFERFFERYVFWLDQMLQRCECEVLPGVEQFVKGLRALRQPPLIGLLTGNIRLGAEIKLRHLNIWDWFETGAFADDHEERGHIAAVARQRGVAMLGQKLRDNEVLVIGDTPLDIQCARFIRARVLAVATGGATLPELKAHQPDWAVPDLNSISPETVLLNAEAPALPLM
jgi:phosphoglycolate phosphatase